MHGVAEGCIDYPSTAWDRDTASMFLDLKSQTRMRALFQSRTHAHGFHGCPFFSIMVHNVSQSNTTTNMKACLETPLTCNKPLTVYISEVTLQDI